MKQSIRILFFSLALLLQCGFISAVHAQITTSFSYTGAQQTWTVPSGVTSVTVDMSGARGGGNGGNGGRVQATLTVTPGQTLYIYVGQQGGTTGSASYNGGGAGGVYSGTYNGSGGGASDIRVGGTALSNRVVVAGGGGGGGTAWGAFTSGVPGGAGGGLTAGNSYAIFDNPVAGGGTQSGSGIYGNNSGQGAYGNAGSLGVGGDGASGTGGCGGGGGGGYYGGGGAGLSSGGGGSSYTDAMLASSVTHTQGYNSGNGSVAITYIAPTAPVFSAQPAGASVCLGAAVTTLTATTDAATYQWYHNSTSIGGATSSSYSISSLAYTDTGTYFLAATNAIGTTYSDTVRVSVLAANTAITSNPSNVHICNGASSLMSGAASGSGLTYQWYVNTGSGFNTISDNYYYTGTNTNTLHFSNVTAAMSGNLYQLTATGTCGSPVTTNSASLTVDTTIVTTSPAASTHICFGSSQSISGAATGPGLSYRWYVSTGGPFTALSNNYYYSGATTNTLQISHAVTAMTGYQYRLTVNSTCNSANTTATTLTVDTTYVTTNPASNTHVCYSGTTTITGAGTGAGAAYQWQVNTGSGYTNISDNWIYSGSATGTLQLTNLITAMTGYQYRLAVIGTCSTVYTTAGTLTVDSTRITTDLPVKSHLCFGGNSPLAAAASGPGLQYQWTINTGSGFTNLSNNAHYSGTTSNTLHVIGSDFSYGGNLYQLNVTGTCGSASTIVTRTVVDSFPLPLAFTPNYVWALQGQVNVPYKTNLDTDVNYVWSYSGTGVSITHSDSTGLYTYDKDNATSGNVSVYVTSPYGCGTTATISQAIGVETHNLWTGAVSKDWNDTNNWRRPIVPYGTISAYIPTILTPMVGIMDTPHISTANTNACYRYYMEANSGLTIDAGLKLRVNSNATLLASVHGMGTLSFGGASAQSITASDTVYNLEINNTQGVTLQVNSRIHIKYNFYPTAGTFTNNGTVFLISDSTGTATMNRGSSAGGYFVGNNINVQKYIHGGRRAYRFLAHPFSSSIALSQLQSGIDITGHGNGFTGTGTNNPSSFWYNPVTGNGSDTNDSTGWTPFTSTDGLGANAWNPYEGLLVMVRGLPGEGLLDLPYTPSATTINMHGPLTQGDHSTTLISNSNVGYNFIANPYASNIDLSTLTLGSSVGPNFWVWDPNAGLAGAYISQPLSVSYILPAYSSFVVTATAATNATVGFHESSKSLATSTNNLFKTTSDMGNNVLQLHVYSDNNTVSWDRLLVYFDGNSSATRDYFDAPKWANDNLNFYTWSADNYQQSIDVRPYKDGEVIKLGLKTDVQKTYTISVDNFNVTGTVQLFLHDKYLNKLQQIHQGDIYTFTVTSDVASQGDNRFELNESGIPNGITNVNPASGLNVDISPNPATNVALLTFAGADKAPTTLQITNIMGATVYAKDLGVQQAGNVSIPVKEFANGIYFITFKSGNQVVTKRFVKD